MLSTCFTACVGALPCGFFQVTPPGTIQFLSDRVLLGNDGAGNDLGIIVRLHPPGLDALNATMQFKFTVPAPLAPGGTFAIISTDDTGFGVFQVNMNPNGTFFVVAGNQRFNGTWTPVAGQDVVVHYETIAGVPHFFLNGVEIPVVFFGLIADFYAPNIILIGGESPVPNQKVPYDFAFINNSSLPPSVIFCCPDGVPSQ